MTLYRLAAVACLVVVAAACSDPARGRRLVLRVADQLYARQPGPRFSTHGHPREVVGSTARTVLADTAAGGAAGPTKQHSVTVAIPADGRLELAYGVAGARPDTDFTARFRVSAEAGGRAWELVNDPVRSSEQRAAEWIERTVPVPTGEVTLRFDATVDPPGAATAHLAAPLVTAPATSAPPRNVLLISLDTLRARQLGLYGYARDTTPHLDREFSQSGVIVERAYTQGTNTILGHVAMLGGMLPSTVVDEERGLAPHAPVAATLAENLRANGYRTAAFTENALLVGHAGFRRGFDVYDENKELDFKQTGAGLIRETFDRGLRWLASHRDEPTFLFLHTYQVHHPYFTVAPFDARFPSPPDADMATRERDAYDRSLAHTDAEVRRLLDRIDEWGLTERTLVIVTSDHGEEFGEHGRRYHGPTAHDEVLRVPLLLRAPGLLPAGVRRSGPAALVDLAATVSDLLGLEAPEETQGLSLAGHLIDGSPLPARSLFHEARAPFALTYDGNGKDPTWITPTLAVTRWPWRLLRVRTNTGPRYELYHLEDDPGEVDDRYRRDGQDFEDLRAQLDGYEASALNLRRSLLGATRSRTDPSALPLDPSRLEKLRALGYLDDQEDGLR